MQTFDLTDHIEQHAYNWSDFEGFIYDLELANDNSNVVMMVR